MKKIILALAFTTLSTVAYSQLVEYKPVIVPKTRTSDVPSYSSPNNTYQQSNQQHYQVIGAYYFDANSQKFKRIKIKVSTVDIGYGRQQLYLRGTYNSFYESWSECNTQVQKVGQIIGVDSDVVIDNFEWKAQSTTLGTIYFNY